MTNCLELKEVSKSFKSFQLKNITFSLPKGYIMGLIGPNGAGKTTTIQLILNMLEKEKGNITILGNENAQCENTIKQEIGVVFDSSFYVDSWTVKETEKAVSLFYDDWDRKTFAELIQRFELPRNKKVRELSRGMQMKLMLACALSHNAKLLILDEPTSGLDSVMRGELLEILQEYIKDGERSVLFSTHITTDLERIADYITFINRGEVFYTGSKEEFVEGYRFIKGGIKDLTDELEKSLISVRKTEVGFEGLIQTKDAISYGNCVLDMATIDDVLTGISKGGRKKWGKQ